VRDGKEPAVLHIANQDLVLEQQVRTMFQRVISSWASDALILRRSGLDRPGARSSSGAPIRPAGHAAQWSELAYREDVAIQWRPQSQVWAGGSRQ
jgi:hypothetical protein